MYHDQHHYHTAHPAFAQQYPDPLTTSIYVQQLQAQTRALEALAHQQRQAQKADRAEAFRQELKSIRDRKVLDAILSGLSDLQRYEHTTTGTIARAMLLHWFDAEGIGHSQINSVELAQSIADIIGKLNQDHHRALSAQTPQVAEKIERSAKALVGNLYARRFLFAQASLERFDRHRFQNWRKAWVRFSWALAAFGIAACFFSNDQSLGLELAIGGAVSAWVGGKIWTAVITALTFPAHDAATAMAVVPEGETEEIEIYRARIRTNLDKLRRLDIPDDDVTAQFVKATSALYGQLGIANDPIAFSSPMDQIEWLLATNEERLRAWLARN